MTKSIIVNKFGGGILQKDLIPFIKKRLKEQMKDSFNPIAVVSAMPKMTDELLSFMEELKSNFKNETINDFIKKIEEKHGVIIDGIDMEAVSKTNAKNEIHDLLISLENDLLKESSIGNALTDKIVSYGERLSAVILTHYLKKDAEVTLFLAENIPIVTNDNFKNADINWSVSEKNIKEKLKNTKGIVVIPGFTGITTNGEITTLGRGGTDTTACFVGAALNAKKIILWKDVGGVLSADPKIVKKAKTIPFINYFEAEEAGKIIHDKAIQYVKIWKTPIEISSLTNPKLSTRIGEMEKIKKGAKIISTKKDLSLMLITDEDIKVNDLLSIVSQTFEKHKIDILLISNTRYSLQIVADNKNGQLENAYNEIKDRVAKVEITDASMIFAVGWFTAKNVSDFNDLLVKLKADLLISAFYYENCYRMEAVIKTPNINKVVETVHKKFIK